MNLARSSRELIKIRLRFVIKAIIIIIIIIKNNKQCHGAVLYMYISNDIRLPNNTIFLLRSAQCKIILIFFAYIHYNIIIIIIL